MGEPGLLVVCGQDASRSEDERGWPSRTVSGQTVLGRPRLLLEIAYRNVLFLSNENFQRGLTRHTSSRYHRVKSIDTRKRLSVFMGTTCPLLVQKMEESYNRHRRMLRYSGRIKGEVTNQFKRNFKGHSRIRLRRSNELPPRRYPSKRLELLHIFAIEAMDKDSRADKTAEDGGDLHGDQW